MKRALKTLTWSLPAPAHCAGKRAGRLEGRPVPNLFLRDLLPFNWVKPGRERRRPPPRPPTPSPAALGAPARPTPASIQPQAQTSRPLSPPPRPPPTAHARPSESRCELLLSPRGAREIFPENLACLPAGWGWAEPHAVKGVDRAASSQAGVLAPLAEIRRWDESMLWTKAQSRLGDSKKRQGDPEIGFGS